MATKPKSLNCRTLVGARSDLERFFEGGHDLGAVLAVVHVDEVDDDDAAKVAQSNLADDFRHRVEVGLDDGVFKPRRLADVLAGVDVDGDQCLGLVDDDGAAALEPDLGAQGLGDFVLNAKLLKEWSLLGVELDAAHQRGREVVEKAHDAFVVGFRIDPDGGEVGADLIAQDALDQREIVIDERGRLGVVGALLDVGPKMQKEAQVSAQILF